MLILGIYIKMYYQVHVQDVGEGGGQICRLIKLEKGEINVFIE